jgi:non-canonical purine NTP pyrophosphatase (RdgB/HAM1 family)
MLHMSSATQHRRVILVATSNPGKVRDFAAIATEHGIEIAGIPGFDKVRPAREDAPTFEANAAKKAEHYSRLVENQMVLADDSGLKVDVLDGAPGVHSARYAADQQSEIADGDDNSPDHANNARLLRELTGVSDDRRTASFVCEIAVARNGRLLAVFHGEVSGTILHAQRGEGGFGYDPLFFISRLNKTFAELSPEEKSSISHRGQAFRKFLKWYEDNGCRV